MAVCQPGPNSAQKWQLPQWLGMKKFGAQMWLFQLVCIVKNSSKWKFQGILYLKTKLIFYSKAYLSGLNIKQNTKNLSVCNIIWHLWCSNNLIHLHCYPHSNLVLILANKISLNVSKTELILFKPRIKKNRFWSQIKTKWQKTLSNYKILKNILVLKLMRVSPGISILMILPLN